MSRCLVLGGARSGKSNYAYRAAEACAAQRSARRLFVATAQALDEEMAARIARHRAERSPDWRSVEAPLHLAEALTEAASDDVVLIDCLTLWLSNSMLEGDDGHAARLESFAASLEGRCGPTWIVSNEVGWGVVPDNALARRFRDETGRLHQSLAALCEEVVLVVAGLPLTLKAPGA